MQYAVARGGRKMKPHQTAWDVAKYLKTNKNKINRPISTKAITHYFLAGAIRELKEMEETGKITWDKIQDVKDWIKELETWKECYFEWVWL